MFLTYHILFSRQLIWIEKLCYNNLHNFLTQIITENLSNIKKSNISWLYNTYCYNHSDTFFWTIEYLAFSFICLSSKCFAEFIVRYGWNIPCIKKADKSHIILLTCKNSTNHYCEMVFTIFLYSLKIFAKSFSCSFVLLQRLFFGEKETSSSLFSTKRMDLSQQLNPYLKYSSHMVSLEISHL